MKTISRLDLYERLWVEPKRDVARSFGVTSDRLSRLCRRNNIPIPVQGFWNRGPEDRAELKLALPDPEKDWEISIEPSEGHVPDATSLEKPGIPLPPKGTRLHPLIRQTRERLQQSPQDEHGRYRPGAGCLDVLVTKKCLRRALRTMHALLAECEARDWAVRVTEHRWPRTIVSVEGGEIAISLEEMLQRGPEMFAEEERLKGRYGMQLYPRFPSGRFVLKTDWPSENGRRAWREGKRFPLEYLLMQFIDGLEIAGLWRRNADERAAKARQSGGRKNRSVGSVKRRRDAKRPGCRHFWVTLNRGPGVGHCVSTFRRASTPGMPMVLRRGRGRLPDTGYPGPRNRPIASIRS